MNIAIIIILIAILGCAFLGFKLFFNNSQSSNNKVDTVIKTPVNTQEVKNIISNDEETILISTPTADLIIENPIDLSALTTKSDTIINTEEEIKPENLLIENSEVDFTEKEPSIIIPEELKMKDNSNNSNPIDNQSQLIEKSNTNFKHISNTNFNPFNV